MHIDTMHQMTRTIVKILPTTEAERALPNPTWAKVAFNQHRLWWVDEMTGEAMMPTTMRGVMPLAYRVTREGEHVLVEFPLDIS